jgi:hypothetical protein
VPLLSIPLASIPEAVILVSGGEDPFEVVFFMVLMSVFGLWVAWPVFLCGTLLLNAAFRRQLRHG